MAMFERIEGSTPNGGACSEIHYLSAEGRAVDEKEAKRCVIRKYDKSGKMIFETWGNVK